MINPLHKSHAHPLGFKRHHSLLMSTRKAGLKRRLLLTKLSDDDTDAVPNTDDQLLIQDIANPNSEKSKKLTKPDSSDEPSIKKKKNRKSISTRRPTVTASEDDTKSIVLALKCQIPDPNTNMPQVLEDDVLEMNYISAPVTASTKPKRAKSAHVKKLKKTTTGSLEVGTDGCGVLVHKPGILSPAQATDSVIPLPNADVLDNGTAINATEESLPSCGNILTRAVPVPADTNLQNEVTGLHANDHHVGVAMCVVESQDSANSKEVAPVNMKALDVVADNSYGILGNTQFPDPVHPSDPDALTVDEVNEITNGLPHIEETIVGNAIESPIPDNLLDLTMSEVINMFDKDSSPSEEVEHPFAPVNIECYSVRPSLAATAQTILSQYGNIVDDSSHSLSFRSYMLECVCLAYQKLEKSTLSKLTLHELQAIRKDMSAVAQLNFNVNWLIKRLDEIHDAKESLEHLSCLGNDRVMSDIIISELEKELEMQKTILQKTQQKVENIEEKIKLEKEKVEAHDLVIVKGKRRLQKFHKKISLVDGM